MFFIVEDCSSPVLSNGRKEPPCKAGSVTILKVGPSRMLPYWIVDLDDNNLHIALQSFDRLIDMLEPTNEVRSLSIRPATRQTGIEYTWYPTIVLNEGWEPGANTCPQDEFISCLAGMWRN